MDMGIAQYGTATYSGACMSQGYRSYGFPGGFDAVTQSQGHMLQQHQQQTQQQPPQWDGAAVQQGTEGSGLASKCSSRCWPYLAVLRIRCLAKPGRQWCMA